MAVQTITATTTGATAAVALNLATFGNASSVAPLSTASVPSGTGVGLLFNVPGGTTCTASVQVAAASGGPWNNHDTMNGMTASQNGSILFPVAYVRLNVTAIGGGGTLTLTVIQPGVN